MQTTDHAERHVLGSLDLLMQRAHELIPGAAFALQEIVNKARSTGVNSLTPAETIYVASLIAEARERAIRNSILAAFGGVGPY